MTAEPGMFLIRRSILVQASPDAVFPKVADFRAWRDWSPYEKLDPQMSRVYSGPDRGRGAAYAWESKGRAGAGRMEILESSPARRIVIQLAFLKPMRATNLAEFTFEPQGAATRVTWSMSGRHTFVSRLMRSVLGLDRMIEKDFDAGLAALKMVSEPQPEIA